jgi:hypothetical protein
VLYGGIKIMINAQEMRNITKQAEMEGSTLFWNEFKDRLFTALKRQAECRCYSLTIGILDEIGKTKQGGSWIGYKPLRDKVQNEIENLGYSFNYNSDREDENVTISWE